MRHQGFTLIELSIVLVIISLIVGGILVGKDLIKAAAMRAQVSQVEQIQTAVMTFKNKYNCIPGDWATATRFFSNVRNGNGNGIICGRAGLYGSGGCEIASTNMGMYWNIGGDYETSYVFDHLASAGLVNLEPYDETSNASNKPGVGFPIMKYQGSGVQNTTSYGSIGGLNINYFQPYLYLTQGHKLTLGACDGLNAAGIYYYCGLTGLEASQFDSKIDDGLPFTGRVTVVGLAYIFRVPSDINDEIGTHCTISHSASDNTYNISYNMSTNNNRRCNPAVNMPF